MNVIAELGHWMPLVPVAVCMVLALSGKLPSADALLLTCVFFISYIADGIGAYLQARDIPNLWLAYVYAPIQFGLLVWIVATDRAVRNLSLVLIALCAIVSIPLRRFGVSEMVTQTTGGAFISLLAWSAPRVAEYRTAIITYCGVAIPFLWLMGAAEPAITGPWVVGWVGYQVTRVVALGIFTFALLRSPGLKVVNGPGHGKVATQHFTSWGRRRGPHRSIVEATVSSRKTG